MSFFTFDGGKDKTGARQMHDTVINPNSCETRIRNNADGSVTMLRTRGGNPEVTTTKPQQAETGIELIEPEYKERTYLKARGGSTPLTEHEETNGSHAPQKELSELIFTLYSVVLRQLGRLSFKAPVDTVKVFDGTWRDADNKTWRDAGFNATDFHKPVLHTSSDGIFTFVAHSPKSASLSIGTILFDAVEKLAGDTPLANLGTSGNGFIKRTFYAPIMARCRGVSRFMARFFSFVIVPIKKVSITGVATSLTFDDPSADAPVDAGYNGDYMAHGIGDPRGATVLKFNPFDHVVVFGQPWHGYIDTVTKLFVPSDGSTPGLISDTYNDLRYARMYPCLRTSGSDENPFKDYSGFTQYVKFDDTPDVPDLAEYGLSTNNPFRKWAVLCGLRRQYSPTNNGFMGPAIYDQSMLFANKELRNSGCFGVNTWLYRTAGGVVWCLWVRNLWRRSTVEASKIEVWGRRVADPMDDFELIYSESPPADGYRLSDDQATSLMSTPNGSKALVGTLVNTGALSGSIADAVEVARLLTVVDGGDYFAKPVIYSETKNFASTDSGNYGWANPYNPSLTSYENVFLAALHIDDSGAVSASYTRYVTTKTGTTTIWNGNSNQQVVTGVSVQSECYVKGELYAADSYSINWSVFTAPSGTQSMTGGLHTVALVSLPRPDSRTFSLVPVTTVLRYRRDILPSGGSWTAVSDKYISTRHAGSLDSPAYAEVVSDDPTTNTILIDKWPW